MNNAILQFLSWQVCEYSNGNMIEYLFEQDRNKTLAMQISSQAKYFCRGPSAAILKMGGYDELGLEGSCVFSFYKESCKDIHNMQLFQFYQYGCAYLLDEIIAVRMSTWDRDTDIKNIAAKKKLDNWNCSAQSIVLSGDTARSILSLGKNVGNLIRSGITHTTNKALADENYVLHTVDSVGITYDISWDDSINLPLIETKIKELQDAVNKTNLECQDYNLTFFFHNK